ncbi:MAG: fructokinase [Firmicutes bacterium HGW-Firmicutes-7]|nr:MAG: fructokinase [Firmicutes bacterium HGW-Firmicutes-7]
MLLGALEAGGTKMVCAIGNENGEILDQVSFPTEEPNSTMLNIIDYFKGKDITGLGIGNFGPLDLNRKSKKYGYITTTPKYGWTNFNMVGTLSDALNVPIGFDTDVNAAALGEATWGTTSGLDSSIYITVGTGIGVGVIVNNQILHGMLHPEAGHVLINKRVDDHYSSNCRFHPNCLEGLASGPAIEGRWGKKAQELFDHESVWDLEADYLAQGIVGYILTLSPQKIVLGGGVMNQTQLFPKIRSKVQVLLNGYIDTSEIDNIDLYIVPSALGGKQGIMGCLRLAYLNTL